MGESIETLGSAQQERLFELETIIAEGLRAFVKVGLALAEVRDQHLYAQEGVDTFEQYCEHRWEMSRSRAYQLIEAASIADLVSKKLNNGGPKNDAQARALAPLKEKPELMVKTWKGVIKEHGKTGVTAERISAAVERVQAEAPEPPPKPAREPARRLPSLETFNLLQGDIEEMGEAIESGTVDLIVTEPPTYRISPAAYPKLWDLAGRVLKDGASVLTVVTAEELPKILAGLGEYPALHYRWLLTMDRAGQAETHFDRHVRHRHDCIVWASRGRFRRSTWVEDAPTLPKLIETFSDKGDLVLDPFCGTAAYGHVAAAAGRRFTGIDDDPVVLGEAKRRTA